MGGIEVGEKIVTRGRQRGRDWETTIGDCEVSLLLLIIYQCHLLITLMSLLLARKQGEILIKIHLVISDPATACHEITV